MKLVIAAAALVASIAPAGQARIAPSDYHYVAANPGLIVFVGQFGMYAPTPAGAVAPAGYVIVQRNASQIRVTVDDAAVASGGTIPVTVGDFSGEIGVERCVTDGERTTINLGQRVERVVVRVGPFVRTVPTEGYGCTGVPVVGTLRIG